MSLSSATGSAPDVNRAAAKVAARQRAFSLVCPHQGTTVNVSGGALRCPNHGATLSASGQWTGGERTTNLREYAVVANAPAGTLSIS